MDVGEFHFEENYDEEDKFNDHKNKENSASKDGASCMSIHIGTDISAKSSHCLVDLLQKCMGRVSLEIKVPMEDDDSVRALLDQIREQLSKDPHVQFNVDKESQNIDCRQLLSTASHHQNKDQSSTLLSREVKFEKMSDVIILYAWYDVFQRLESFAKQRKVLVRITSEGFLLQGRNETQLHEVESYIKGCHNDIISLKLFKDEPLEKISAASYAFKNIKEGLAKKANLRYIFTLTSDQYYTAFKEVSKKVPELANHLTEEKLKKTNLRLVLNRRDIRNDQDIAEKEFRKLLAENTKTFKEIIRIESNEPLSQEDLNGLRRLASKTNFYFTYEPNKIVNDQQSLKIKSVQQMTLLTYYSQESEKADLQRAANLLKKNIIRQIRPVLMYEFVSATDHLKYDKFVRPEIQENLKEKSVSVEIVRNECSRKGLALKIQGDKKEAHEIKDLVANLMNLVKHRTYFIKSSTHVTRELVRQENDDFFLSYFDQVYKNYPNVKLIKSLAKDGRGVAIEILYKNDQELKELTTAFNHDFSELTSKLVDFKVSELLGKGKINLKEFKKSQSVMISEFFDQKAKIWRTAVVGDHLSVKAALEVIQGLNESAKPLTVDIDIESRLLQRAFKKEESNLIPRGISCKLSDYSVTISGDASKVPEIQKKIETFLSSKEKDIVLAELPKIPSSHLKAIESKEKWFADLQDSKEVEISLIKPRSAKLNLRMGLRNGASKKIILVQGDITKIQVDAIVNSTNLLFNNATIVQGVAKAILDKAGESYVEECLSHGELRETHVFVSKAGHLKSCKNIINVCPPLYSSDQTLGKTLTKLKESVFNVLKESRYNFKTIAIPLLSAGNYGMPAKEAIECLIEELAQDLFFVKSQLEKIFICEIDDNKLRLAEKKLRSLDPTQQMQEVPLKYQWQWLDDGNIWKDYDVGVNQKLDYAFSQGQTSVEIKFPVSRSIGTHTVNLVDKTLVRKSTKETSRIKRMHDGWYENGLPFSSEISEIIDLKDSQQQKVFDIFLNEYTVDMKSLSQINKQTKFVRKVRSIKPPMQSKTSTFVITGVSIMDQSELIYDDIFGKINIRAFSKVKVLETKNELEQFIKNLLIQAEVEIPQNVGEENLKYIEVEIQKNLLEVSGSVQPGQKIKIEGIRSVINKIQNILKTIKLAASAQEKLPENWTKMNDHFELVSLEQNSKEWTYVFSKLSKTLAAQKVKIFRIQNAKFWKDYCQERENLKKLRQKLGLSEHITEDWLWHGSRGVHPKTIYEGMEECFDMQCANDGMWGRGLYFAVNASYSDGYASPTTAGTKLMMLCRVMIGDSITLNSDHSLRKPPPRTDVRDGSFTYESVKGHTGGSEIYILYRMRRAYPEYLVEY